MASAQKSSNKGSADSRPAYSTKHSLTARKPARINAGAGPACLRTVRHQASSARTPMTIVSIRPRVWNPWSRPATSESTQT